MSSKVNRRDQIVETAAELFVKKGYVATSVREITDAVGITEAALYYHFKEGKRELLGAVCELYSPDLLSIVAECKAATSLSDFILRFGMATYSRLTSAEMERFRWLQSEFSTFNDEERALFNSKHLEFHAGITDIIQRFIDDREEAARAAWMIFSVIVGYGQLFLNFSLKDRVDFSPQDMMSMLSKALMSLYGQE